MKNKILFFLLIISVMSFSQKKRSTKVGLTSIEELKLGYYDKDSTANALVLYEHANTYLSEKDDLYFKTDFYYRIKLFDNTSFHRATIKVKLYKKEKIREIEAYAFNLENGAIVKTKLLASNVYTKDIDKNWTEVTFTIPAIKEGTVIEYQYSVISPYSRVDDWYFQSDIPKLKSDFTISYLGNYKYKIRLTGYLKLDRNDKKVEKKCLHVPRVGRGDCANILYGIDNIPAFKEEDYMLSKENFISRISFDLISISRTDGSIIKFSKTWKDVDRSFKNDFLDGQTSKKKFFKNKLPKKIVETEDDLERAKLVYKLIQDRFNWNERYWTKKKIKIKDVYEERTGSVDAINLSLYNSLKAVNIDCYIVMISTRDQAVPTKLYPVRTDFNYALVKAVINNKTYFLDATDKFLFFGQIPLRCLNGDGRVLDFEKGSYWEYIKPILNTSSKIRVNLNLNEQNKFIGEINVEKNGYHAKNNRDKLSKIDQDDFLTELDVRLTDFEIEDYSFINLDKPEEPFFEIIKFKSDSIVTNSSIIQLNPFFYHRIEQNPFKLKTRNYPVDFGFPRTYTYTINIEIPEGYKIKKKPKDIGFKLPHNGGRFILKSVDGSQKLTLHFRYQIKKKFFSNKEYHYLKEFFNKIIKIHNQNIELRKI